MQASCHIYIGKHQYLVRKKQLFHVYVNYGKSSCNPLHIARVQGCCLIGTEHTKSQPHHQTGSHQQCWWSQSYLQHMKFLPLPDSLLLCKATIKFVPSKPTVQHYRQNVRSLKIDIYFFISIDIEKLLFFILNCSSNEQCCDTQGNVLPCVIKQRHVQRTPSAVCPAVVMEEGPIKKK